MTAVEWLYDQIKNGFNYDRLEVNGYENQRDRLFEQAKAMEKEQIDNAWDRGYKQGYYDPEFKNETFKSE